MKIKFENCKVVRETEKAYLINYQGVESWMPKSAIKTNGELKLFIVEEIELKILNKERDQLIAEELGSINFWKKDTIQRIYFEDGSYAQRIIENSPYAKHRYCKGEIVWTYWSANSGLALEKIEKVSELFC